MSRIVVVSRNPTLAWGLSAEGRELEEVRPHQLDGWLDNARHDNLDLIVLDLDDPERSLDVVTALRARAQMAPALLVSGDASGWDAVAQQQLPAAEVLPLPVTTAALQLAVGRLLEGRALVAELTGESFEEPSNEPGVQPSAESGAVPAADGPAQGELPDAPPIEPAGPPPEPVAVQQSPPPVPRPREPIGEHHSVPIPGLRRSSKTSKTVRDALANRRREADPPAAPESLRSPEFADGSPALFDTPTSGRAPGRHAGRPDSASPIVVSRGLDNANALARALTLRVDELYSVAETAEVIVLDTVERVRSDSAALMLPDGGRWRVAGGAGLGTIERRFELDEDSWVVANIARGSRGVIVEDTDVARRPFQNAPLASRRHLLAAPIALVEGILLVARDEDPSFTEDELVVLAGLAEEAGLLLAAALDVRELARRLVPLADTQD